MNQDHRSAARSAAYIALFSDFTPATVNRAALVEIERARDDIENARSEKEADVARGVAKGWRQVLRLQETAKRFTEESSDNQRFPLTTK